uniref:(northern house mosquito) hypothetical protein n=1 Tax=Culex pipiens TaxID=7175 RepID=A0A8D8C199_CULPI
MCLGSIVSQRSSGSSSVIRSRRISAVKSRIAYPPVRFGSTSHTSTAIIVDARTKKFDTASGEVRTLTWTRRSSTYRSGVLSNWGVDAAGRSSLELLDDSLRVTVLKITKPLSAVLLSESSSGSDSLDSWTVVKVGTISEHVYRPPSLAVRLVSCREPSF